METRTDRLDTILSRARYIPSSASYVHDVTGFSHRPNLHGTFVPARLSPSKSLRDPPRYIVERQGRSYCYYGKRMYRDGPGIHFRP